MLLVPLRRVSSGKQVEGSGLQRQEDKAPEYAKTRGWALHPDAYSDEGVSAYNGANLDGDLGRFLSDYKRGHFGDQPVALGIEDLDRLSRQFSLAFLPVLVDDLLNAGVTLSVMKKGRDISRESVRQNQMEIHELLFWMNAAHEFSEKLSGRISDHRARLRQQIREGKPTNPGKAPSWLDLKNGKWVINDFAVTIRRVIEMSQSGIGAPTICRTLNEEGIPSPGTRVKRRTKPKAKAKTWSPTVVLQILHSPSLHGARVVAAPGRNAELRAWKEDCAHKLRQGVLPEHLPEKPKPRFEPDQEDYYPALLTIAEHDALKSLLNARTTTDAKGRSDLFLWIGQRMTFCACGARLTTYSTSGARSGPKNYRYLRCVGRRDGTTDCQAAMVPMPLAQSHLLTRLTADNFGEMLRVQSNENVKGQLSELTEQRQRLLKTVESNRSRIAAGETALSAADDASVVAVLAKRQVTLQDELKDAYVGLDAVELQLQQLQATGSREEMAQQAKNEIKDLLARFAAKKEEPTDRQLVNEHLRKLGMRIVIDADQMGIGIGDHAPVWQRMNARLDAVALAQGMVNAQDSDFQVDAETLERLKELLPSVDGVADMTPLFEALGIKSDEAGLIDLSPKQA